MAGVLLYVLTTTEDRLLCSGHGRMSWLLAGRRCTIAWVWLWVATGLSILSAVLAVLEVFELVFHCLSVVFACF